MRKVRSIERLMAAAVLIAACVLLAPATGLASLDTGPWPMFHQSADHVAFTTLQAPSDNTLSWSAALSDTVEFSSPVVTSFGRVYLGDQGKELWAFDIAGNAKWNYHTGGNLRYSSPAVGDDWTIYIGSADGLVYAVRPDSSLKWTAATGGAVKTSPAIAADGTIYVGSDDGNLWALDPNDGHTLWTYPATDTVRSSPAVGPDGTVYFGSHDGFIRAVYPDGTLRWIGATGGPIKTAPVVYHDRVIVASGDGFLYSIDRRTGDLFWATYTGNNLRSSPAVGVTGKIFMGEGNDIVCYHDDGSPCWSYPTLGRVFSSPAVTFSADSLDVVLCGSDDGSLYCLKDGFLLWQAVIGSPVRSSPAIGADGYAYVGAMDGRIYCYGAYAPNEVPPPDLDQRLRLAIRPNPVPEGQNVRIRLLGPLGDGPLGPLTIFDPTGRRVRTIRLSREQTVTWDGRNEAGRPVPAGIYLTRWIDGTEQISGRLVRLR